MFVLWFHTFKCFWIWLKSYAKLCANNSLLSRNKTISSFLKLICHVFWFQNMFWKNSRFQFWWKTHTKPCTNNDVISRVRGLSLCALCGGSIPGYNFGKQKNPNYWKTIELKISRWKFWLWFFCCCFFFLLWFTLLSTVAIVAASCFNYISPSRWF